jgi:hypothetical protein
VKSEDVGNRQRIMRVLRNSRMRRLQLAFLGATVSAFDDVITRRLYA